MIVDTASVTVFANDGEVVITEPDFPRCHQSGAGRLTPLQDAVEVLSFTPYGH
ncbi:hypothetical protein P4S72_24155 [Vibrio sp. PP-XX7]